MEQLKEFTEKAKSDQKLSEKTSAKLQHIN